MLFIADNSGKVKSRCLSGGEYDIIIKNHTGENYEK